MSQLSEFLAAHGWMLACGVTPLLLGGALLAAMSRSVVLRQRICELSVLAAVTWVVLASVPMQRVTWKDDAPRQTQPVAISKPAPTPIFKIPDELIAKPSAIEQTPAHSPTEAVVAPPAAAASPAARSNSSAPPFDWGRLLAGAFLAGAVISAVWVALGQLLLWRMIRRSTAAPAHVMELLEAAECGAHRGPAVWITPGLSRPVTCGVLRPAILLPNALLTPDCAGQLRQVLLHELGHVRQGDGWGSLLFCLALPLLYWHPGYWWLRRCASLARELVADDWAAQADGKEAYVSELVALARTRISFRASPIGAIGILQNRSHFYRRMHMLLQRQRPLATRCSKSCRMAMGTTTLAAVIAMAAAFGVPSAKAQPQSTAADKTAPATDHDYVIAPNDVLRITITNAAGPGAETVKTVRVNEKGNISIPLLNTIKASGLTPTELAQSISQRYRDANLIQNAPVAVELIEKSAGAPLAGAADDPGPAGQGSDTTSRPGGARQAVYDLSNAQIGMLDVAMRKLLEQRDALAKQASDLRDKGLSAEHPEMKRLSSQLDEMAKKIEQYAHDWRDLQTKYSGDPLVSKPAPGRLPAAREGEGTVPGAAIGGVQLDLVNLANKIVDTVGEVRIAKAELGARKRLAEASGGSDLELATAEAKLETAGKRLELLKGIASIALDGATLDFKRSTQLYEQGMQDHREVSQAESKMKMLQLIVKSAG